MSPLRRVVQADLCSLKQNHKGKGGVHKIISSQMDKSVQCYNPANRRDRKSTWSKENPNGRWRAFDYEELINRDKASLDIFWIKDESLEESENLPDPDVLAQSIVEDLEAALEQFREIANDVGVENGLKNGE